MKKQDKEKYSSLIGLIIVIIFFILSSFIVQNNIGGIKELLSGNIYGMAIYVIFLVIATVIAPINAMPLLPLASNSWGFVNAALLSILGWLIGAMIAFHIARKYGLPIVKKFVSLKSLKKFENRIPKENLFWGIVVLRMTIPVDILSYALGLLSDLKYKTYFFATLIGITPLAFLFAYLGSLPFIFQLTGILISIFIVLLGYDYFDKKSKKK